MKLEKSEIELFQDDKRKNQKLSTLLKNIDPIESDKLNECCDWYQTNVYTKKTNFDDVKTNQKINHTCKSKFCVICEKRKNRLFYNGITEQLQKLDKTKFGIVFVTLTVENPKLEDLDKTLKEMSKSQELFRKNLQYNYFGKQTSKEGGYFSSTEITYTNKFGDLKIENNHQMCHPHKHMLLIVPKEEIDNKTIDPNYFRQLWTNSLKKNSNLKGNINLKFIKGVSKTVKELVKYTTKHQEFIKFPQLIPAIKKQLKGKRMYQSSGLLKTTLVKEKDTLQKKMELETDELKQNYKKRLTYKRIYNKKKKYYNIYGLEWDKTLTEEDKLSILISLKQLGKLQQIEYEYLMSKVIKGKLDEIELEELYKESKFKFINNIQRNIVQVKEYIPPKPLTELEIKDLNNHRCSKIRKEHLQTKQRRYETYQKQLVS